jgi:hypothetical protein
METQQRECEWQASWSLSNFFAQAADGRLLIDLHPKRDGEGRGGGQGPGERGQRLFASWKVKKSAALNCNQSGKNSERGGG